MTSIEDLERRVSALEAAQKQTKESQEWMAATLGRIAAVQDDHTQRLQRLETDLKSLREDLPGIVGDAVRDAFKSQR
jgi:chromosome segregation ATPase